MRVHIYILASTPTCIAAPHSFIKINHFRTSAANKVDSGPRPGQAEPRTTRRSSRWDEGGCGISSGSWWNVAASSGLPCPSRLRLTVQGPPEESGMLLRRRRADQSSSFGFDSGTDAIISSPRRAGGAASGASMTTGARGEEPPRRPGALFCVGGRPSVCRSAPPALSRAAK